MPLTNYTNYFTNVMAGPSSRKVGFSSAEKLASASPSIDNKLISISNRDRTQKLLALKVPLTALLHAQNDDE